MESLNGKNIRQIFLAADEQLLVFATDQGRVAYEVDGDCCSTSRFVRISGVNNLIGHTVQDFPDDLRSTWSHLNVEYLESREEDWDYIQPYLIRIRTEVGEAEIVFENHSNGYYGGWMSPTDASTDDLLRRHGSPMKVEEDWEAGR